LLAVVATVLALTFFTLGSQAQEKDKEEAAAPKFFPTAPGLVPEYGGFIRIGNPETRYQKGGTKQLTDVLEGKGQGMKDLWEYFGTKEPPHLVGGTVYYAVFRNQAYQAGPIQGQGAYRRGDTFGTGMPGGLDNKFVPGDGIYRANSGARVLGDSPRLDTTAKYLILFQVISSKGLDPRGHLSPVEYKKVDAALRAIFGVDEAKAIKLAVGEDKVKLEKKQKDTIKNLADAVNKAVLPDEAIEDIHRFAVELNTDPQYITSFGHFEDAGFAVNIVNQKTYRDLWGLEHKMVSQGGVIPDDIIPDRTQAISFLPGLTELHDQVAFERAQRGYHSLVIMQGSFHVDDPNAGIEKSLHWRFYQAMFLKAGPELKFAGTEQFKQGKKPDFAVKPANVRILIGDEMNLEDPRIDDWYDDQHTTSALIVDFDPKHLTPRANAEEVRGIPRTKHSVVFGFTTNLEPIPDGHVRLDSLESNDRNKNLPFNEFFSVRKTTPVASARKGFSRSYDFWMKGKQDGKQDEKEKKGAGLGRNIELALAEFFAPENDTDADERWMFVLQGGGAGSGGGAGGAAIGDGGISLSRPVAPGSSGGMSVPGGLGGGGAGGGGGAPMGFPGLGGGFSRGSGFGGGGGFGNGNGNGQGNATTTSDAKQAQAGQQIVNINFNATLTNQQSQEQSQFQQQQQQQQQNQNQKNRGGHGHDHGHRHRHHGGDCNNGHVVPAPASLLLGLLGLPGLWFLRRRKGAEATSTEVA
jgi:hypothetical protein